MYKVDFRTDLTAHDFGFEKVIIQHEDGTRCEFAHAFMEEGEAQRSNGKRLPIVKVYTEHNGNYWFATDDLVYWRVDETSYPITWKDKWLKLVEYWRYLNAHW